MTQKQLERQISQTYGQAQKEIAKYTEEYFEKFQVRDEVKRQQVADGIITEDEYQGWLDGQKAYMARNEQLLNAVTKEYENADKTAEKWINGELPYAYVEGYNATGKGIEGEVTGYSFSMIDKNAVKSMMGDGDIPITTYTAGTEKHTAYVDKKARQAITQGIIQGDSVADVSKKVSQSLGVVTDKERKATIRNTRTLMNSAHNSGGYMAMADASEDGIILDKQWIATKDEVTRDSHAFLDGEIVKWDKPFSNGLMFPQDYNGEPSEVYNCRCTMREVVKGFYNKYTGKTEMLDDVPQEKYAEESREYWDKYYADKETEEDNSTSNSEHLDNARAMKDEYRQRLEDGEWYIGYEDLVKIGNETEQLYLEKLQSDPDYIKMEKLKKERDELDRQIRELRAKEDKLCEEYSKDYKVMREIGQKVNEGTATAEEIERYKKYNELIEEHSAVRKEWFALSDRQDVIDEELKNLNAENIYLKNYKAAVSEIRGEGFGRGKYTEEEIRQHLGNGGSKSEDAIVEAYENYPNGWVKKSVERSQMYAFDTERGFTNQATGEIAISGYDDKDRKRVATHELGHRMEYSVSEVLESERDFYAHRTQGEEEVWMGDLSTLGKYTYRYDEYTKPDNFVTPYMGKDYGGNSYELMSAGYERITDERHEEFRKSDPEMYRWMTGMLVTY